MTVTLFVLGLLVLNNHWGTLTPAQLLGEFIRFSFILTILICLNLSFFYAGLTTCGTIICTQ